MKLSVYTLACPEFTVEETVAQLSELGIPGVEWRVGDVDEAAEFNPLDPGRFWGTNRATLPADRVVEVAREVAEVTRQHGLEASFLAGGPPPTQHEVIRRQMEAARILGAPAMRVSAGGGDEESPQAAFDQARREWDEVEKLAEKTGVKAVIETHHGALVPSASSVRRFLEGRDPQHVGVLWDPGNVVWEGYERPEYGLRMVEPWLAHVHLKNARPVVTGAGELRQLKWSYEWCGLRQGVVDWPSVVETLREVGYEGYLSLEDFNPDTQAEEKLADFADYFGAILA